MAGIYIHIPFCKQACSYCDFYFITRDRLRNDFVARVCEEIDHYRGSPMARETIETVYLGGGTPSLLTPGELEQIFDHLHRTFRIEPVEVTMEMNPDDVSPDYLRQLRQIGITRASMGVQTFDPERLRFMNRAHSRNEAIAALRALNEAEFDSWTADLIYGNPGQTGEELAQDVEKLMAFEPPHISAYSLTIEPRTRLGKAVSLGRVIPAEDEEVAEQFDLLSRQLTSYGLRRYEVSNFSKPGYEAVHNTRYWHHTNYLGFGPSAHSFWQQEGGGRRWLNARDIRKYLSEPFEENREQTEELTLETLAEERLMLGLRTSTGVLEEELERRYGYRLNQSQREWLNQQRLEGWVADRPGAIALTEEGFRLADYLVVELLRRG